MASAPEPPSAPVSQPTTTTTTTTTPTPTPTPHITLRQPSTSTTPHPATSPPLTPPTLSWLQGPWTVTHSTLPMWRKARNVVITYTPIPSSGSAGGLGHTSGTHLEDVVTYQSLDKGAGKVSRVRGVDKPIPVDDAPVTRGVVVHADTAPPAATKEGEELAALGYQWRGKGWLVIASSKWEILGWGDELQGGNGWVVTYFQKTLFTPAGVDFYSRKGRLAPETVEGIKKAIQGLGGDVARLGGEVFEVAFDGEREGSA